MTDELQAEMHALRALCNIDRPTVIERAVPALLKAAETLIGLQLPEHALYCPKGYGYDHMGCGCDKDEIDAALADLLAGLKGDR